MGRGPKTPLDAGRIASTAALVACFSTAVVVGGIVFSSTAPFGSHGDLDHYYGFRVLPPGPAINGLPIIPVRVTPDGLVGLATHTDWYQYCAPAPSSWNDALPPGQLFRYHWLPERLERMHSQGLGAWWESLSGRIAQPEDFPSAWDGAPVAWRDPNGHPQSAMVFRIEPGTYTAAIEKEFASDGFIAAIGVDTHYCCPVGYGENSSPKARKDGAPVLFDTCHDDRYDVREIRRYDMPPGMVGHD